MIRHQVAGVPTHVILLTAKQAIRDFHYVFRACADDYLPKPYNAQELRARLRAARRIIELEDQLRAAQETLEVETIHDPLTGL